MATVHFLNILQVCLLKMGVSLRREVNPKLLTEHDSHRVCNKKC